MEATIDLSLPEQIGDKSELIEAVTNADESAYQSWVNDQNQPKRLDTMPVSALRHLAIPRKLLEMVDDPKKVGIIVNGQQNGALDLLVTEHRTKPVTNKESLERYLQNSRKFDEEERAKQKAQGKRIYIRPPGGPTKPPDVDEYHVKYANLIESGSLQTTDFVTHHLNLRTSDDPEVLYVSHYDDREELRGKGIAGSFHERLPQVARDLGARYIVGWNEEGNVGYFTNKLGRSRINEIKPEERVRFGATQSEIQGTTRPGDKIRTIQFLYPEEKSKYLIS